MTTTGPAEPAPAVASKALLRIGALAAAERLAFYAWMNPVLVAWVASVASIDGTQPIAMGLLRLVAGKAFGELSGPELGLKVLGVGNVAFFLALVAAGLLADRRIGARRASLAGSVLVAAGLVLLSTKALALLSLIVLVAGSALLRATIPAQIAALYPDRLRQEQALALFVLATNAAVAAALVTGTCGSPALWVCREVSDVGSWQRLNVPIAGGVMVASLLVYARGRTSVRRDPRDRSWRPFAIATILTAGLVLFGICIDQVHLLNELIASKANLAVIPFSDWEVQPHWLGQLPVNLLCLFLFTPLIVLRWKRQARNGTPTSTSQKLAISCLHVVAGFLVLLVPELADGRSSGWWLILSTLFLTVGEVYFAATALAGVMRCAPARFASTSVAILFVFRDFLCDYVASAGLKVRGEMSQVTFTIVLAGVAAVLAAGIMLLRRPLDAADDVSDLPKP